MLHRHKTLVIAALIAMTAGTAFAADDRKAGSGEVNILGHTTYAPQHKTIVLNDPNAPLQIEAARTFFISESQRSEIRSQVMPYLRRYIPQGPIVEIDAVSFNVSAVKFGVLFYDSFNESAGGFTGVSTEPPSFKMQWNGRENVAWRGFGIACIFVRAVRLTDGQVWKADLKKISIMMVAEGCSAEGREGAMKHLKELPKGATRL